MVDGDGKPFSQTQEPLRMMEPPPFIKGSAFWTVKYRPRALVLKVLSKCSGVTSGVCLSSTIPALAKRISILRFCAATVLYKLSRSSSLDTSLRTAVTHLADFLDGFIQFRLAP